MLTVPEAASRIGLDPETVRCWIGSGMLPAKKIGAQYLIDEGDVQPFEGEDGLGWIPEQWRTFLDGRPQPNWESIVRRQRESH